MQRAVLDDLASGDGADARQCFQLGDCRGIDIDPSRGSGRSRRLAAPQRPGYVAPQLAATPAAPPADPPAYWGRVEIWTCISSCKRTARLIRNVSASGFKPARPRNHVYYPISPAQSGRPPVARPRR